MTDLCELTILSNRRVKLAKFSMAVVAAIRALSAEYTNVRSVQTSLTAASALTLPLQTPLHIKAFTPLRPYRIGHHLSAFADDEYVHEFLGGQLLDFRIV